VKIGILPFNFEAVGEYRVHAPARELEAQYGWEHETWKHIRKEHPEGAPGNPDVKYTLIFDVSRPPDCDIAVLQNPLHHALPAVIRLLQGRGTTVVIDLDDHYLGIPASSAAHSASAPSRNREQNTNHMKEALRFADAVTVSTSRLAEIYHRFNRNVHILPNYLNWETWWNLKPNYERRRRTRIGWAGAMKWRPDDIALLRGVIGPWMQAHPDWDFVAAGDPQIHEHLAIPVEQRVSFERADFDRYAEVLDFDIGLIPLADNEFNACKSWLKGIEYMAAGIAWVASDSREYRDLNKVASGNLIARRGHDWARALFQLSDNWRDVAYDNRARVANLTIQRQVWLWYETFTEIHERSRWTQKSISV
jgi:hypothetical protein